MRETRFVSTAGASAAQLPLGVLLPHEPPAPQAAQTVPCQRLLDVLKCIFSFPAMLGTMLVGVVLVPGRNFAVDPDLWWHIRNGQNILATHRWPTTDPYSFTVAGTSWLAYEWLGDVLLGFMAKSGLQALDGLLITLASLVILALYYYSTLCSENSKAGFVSS